MATDVAQDRLGDLFVREGLISGDQLAEALADAIRETAVSEGMLSLRDDGLKKVERGITILEEVVRETAVVV